MTTDNTTKQNLQHPIKMVLRWTSIVLTSPGKWTKISLVKHPRSLIKNSNITQQDRMKEVKPKGKNRDNKKILFICLLIYYLLIIHNAKSLLFENTDKISNILKYLVQEHKQAVSDM